MECFCHIDKGLLDYAHVVADIGFCDDYEQGKQNRMRAAV